MLLARAPRTFIRPLMRCFATKTQKFYDRDLKLEDSKAVTEFYNKYFIPSDPIHTALGITAEITHNIGDMLLPHLLTHPVSFLTFSEHNQLAGLKLNSILDFNPETEPPEYDVESMPPQLVQVIAMATLFEEALPILVPNVTRWMYLYIGCINTDFRRQGLATRNWHKSLDLAKDLKCEGAFSVAISAGSQKGLMKMGFECVKEVKYKEYVDPISGENIFKSIEEPESVKLLVKTF